jgi:predicted phosphodiesterase
VASTTYRIAFLTDIHGNLHGLTAVLDAIRSDAPDLILVGGDFTYKFPYPRESLELLDTVDYLAVRGNTDIYVSEWATPDTWPTWLAAEGAAHAQWTRAAIGDAWAARLAALPLTRTITVAGADGGAGELLLMHGTPHDPFIGIHNAPGPDNAHPRWAMPDEVVAQHLDGVTARIILAGHTHVPLLRPWRGGTIVNPGAVAHIWHPTPDAHLARYALLTYRPSGEWAIELRAVPYDNAAAVHALRTIETYNPLAERIAALIAPPKVVVSHGS